MENFKAGWYVVYTKPKHEKKVAERLEEYGINYFLPLMRTLRTWHDRKKYIFLPLFPSYIFVYLNNKSDYFGGLNIESVWYYVKSGKEAARVPDKIISDLQMLIAGAYDIEVTFDHFQPGCQLAISKGPLSGLSCELVEHKGQKGFLVRVNLLQRSILVSLPSECLMAIPA